MRFHPDGQFIYVANELSVSVTTYRYDAADGAMEAVQTIDSVSPADRAAARSVSTSEIVVHPNGRFVYVANRGHDTLSVFAVDPQTHTLQSLQQEPVRGAHPRHFNIDPTGRWLVVASRDSNNLTVFEIDAGSGGLTFSGQSVFVPAPICVLFGPARTDRRRLQLVRSKRLGCRGRSSSATGMSFCSKRLKLLDAHSRQSQTFQRSARGTEIRFVNRVGDVNHQVDGGRGNVQLPAQISHRNQSRRHILNHIAQPRLASTPSSCGALMPR